MKLNKKIKILALTLGLTTMLSSKSYAAASYDYGHAELMNKLNQEYLSQFFMNSLDATKLAIVEGLRQLSGQQTKSSIEDRANEQRVQEAMDIRNQQRAIQEASYESIKNVNGSASGCSNITQSLATQNNQKVVAYYKGATTKNLEDWELGSGGMTTENGSHVGIQRRLDIHAALYCDEDSVRAGLCTAPVTEEKYQNADIQAGKSLFSNSSDALSQQAMDMFIINATSPVAEGASSKGMATRPNGREELARKQSRISKLSLGQEALSYLAANAKGIPDVEGSIEKSGFDWAKETAQNIPGFDMNRIKEYQSVSVNGVEMFEGGVSENLKNELTAKYRYLSPEWQRTQEKSTSTPSLLKELNTQIAFLNYQTWQNNEIMKRILAINAVKLTNEVDKLKDTDD